MNEVQLSSNACLQMSRNWCNTYVEFLYYYRSALSKYLKIYRHLNTDDIFIQEENIMSDV